MNTYYELERKDEPFSLQLYTHRDISCVPFHRAEIEVGIAMLQVAQIPKERQREITNL